MKLPLSIVVKNFLGIYALTPFEQELLKQLSAALDTKDQEILSHQLAHFTTVRRVIRHLDVPNAYGFTNFHTIRFGKEIEDSRQTMKFNSTASSATLATARVIFDKGEIEVKFILVRGVFFRIEYRSPQRIYYPTDDYRIEGFRVWPQTPKSQLDSNVK